MKRSILALLTLAALSSTAVLAGDQEDIKSNLKKSVNALQSLNVHIDSVTIGFKGQTEDCVLIYEDPETLEQELNICPTEGDGSRYLQRLSIGKYKLVHAVPMASNNYTVDPSGSSASSLLVTDLRLDEDVDNKTEEYVVISCNSSVAKHVADCNGSIRIAGERSDYASLETSLETYLDKVVTSVESIAATQAQNAAIDAAADAEYNAKQFATDQDLANIVAMQTNIDESKANILVDVYTKIATAKQAITNNAEAYANAGDSANLIVANNNADNKDQLLKTDLLNSRTEDINAGVVNAVEQAKVYTDNAVDGVDISSIFPPEACTSNEKITFDGNAFKCVPAYLAYGSVMATGNGSLNDWTKHYNISHVKVHSNKKVQVFFKKPIIGNYNVIATAAGHAKHTHSRTCMAEINSNRPGYFYIVGATRGRINGGTPCNFFIVGGELSEE